MPRSHGRAPGRRRRVEDPDVGGANLFERRDVSHSGCDDGNDRGVHPEQGNDSGVVVGNARTRATTSLAGPRGVSGIVGRPVRGCSSAGRALRSHRRSRGFESHHLHQRKPAKVQVNGHAAGSWCCPQEPSRTGSCPVLGARGGHESDGVSGRCRMAVWPFACRGLDDSKTMQPNYFIRRARDDPMVFAGSEPATTGSEGWVRSSRRCPSVR
jgi:hypothetical protein